LYIPTRHLHKTTTTDSAGLPAPGAAIAPSTALRASFRCLRPGEEPEGPVCSAVVMEYCDCGSLRDALKRGVFHRRLPSGTVGVDLAAVLSVLAEVAGSLQHLHGFKLVHCDLKPENVLLKSDASRPLGFTPKLADFGLVKLLKDDYARNRSGAGTVTHLAPEMLVPNARITVAADTFAFGVVMVRFVRVGWARLALSRVHLHCLRGGGV
jgi:serine/threonine protein kinase